MVELLVVVALLLILIGITITTVDFTFTSERVRSGARQVQSALEGARDRAIFAREPRGLRLLVDPDEPRMVTSMVYIGGTKNWNEGQIRLERLDVAPTDSIADGPEVLIVRGDAATAWYGLKQRGYLGTFEDLNFNNQLDSGEDQNGNGQLDLDAPRIKIPADDNGSWYTVLTHRLTPANQILQLVTPYRDSGTTPPNEVVAFQGTGPNTYILELPPRILPDAQPILLPQGVVLDLDGSAIPAEWCPGIMSPMPALEAQYQLPYSSHMDIMFSPRGVVTGPLAAFGLIHLYLAETKDTVFLQDQGLNQDSGSPTRRPPRFAGAAPLVPGVNQFGTQDPMGQRLLISIFTQTGKVSTHQVNPVDDVNNGTGASGADGYADAPFLFATQGEAQSQ